MYARSLFPCSFLTKLTHHARLAEPASNITSIYLHSSCRRSEENKITPSNCDILKSSSDEIGKFLATVSLEKRQEILFQIQKLEAEESIKAAQDKLASRRWRSRFGRPSLDTKNLGADPTGTFCNIPEGWIKEKAALAAIPTSKQFRQLTLFNALPFIGFGFLDNVIMILAGEYIDVTLGIMFNISTLAAAALGNTISDLAGIGSAWYVESAAERIGFTMPNMTTTQLESSKARWCANGGRGLGVVVGCILGMFPLLFMNTSKSNASKKDPDPAKESTESKLSKKDRESAQESTEKIESKAEPND